MIESIKKAILFGLGAFDLSKEKLSDGVNDFLKNENIDKKEGRKMVEEVLKKAEKEKNKHEKYIKNVVKNVMSELEVATKKDLESLKKSETAKVVRNIIDKPQDVSANIKKAKKAIKKDVATMTKKPVVKKASVKTTKKPVKKK